MTNELTDLTITSLWF